jgi:predicted Zn-dependent peptidase
MLFDLVMQEHFGPHPLARAVLGTRASVTALTPARMRGYFDAHYGPGNMVLAVAGNLDFAALARQAQTLCGTWPRVNADRDYAAPQLAAQRRHIHDAKATRHYITMLCPGPSAQDLDRYAAQVLADAMGDHEGSRLFWSLIEPGLADEIELSFFPHDRTGSFLIYVSCDPERAAQVEAIVMSELARARAAGITDAEIERSKNKIDTATVLQGELPLGRMRALAARWLYNGDYAPLEEELACLEAVTPAAVNAILARYPFAPLTVVTLGPEKT